MKHRRRLTLDQLSARATHYEHRHRHYNSLRYDDGRLMDPHLVRSLHRELSRVRRRIKFEGGVATPGRTGSSRLSALWLLPLTIRLPFWRWDWDSWWLQSWWNWSGWPQWW